jgi:hypothetical protein
MLSIAEERHTKSEGEDRPSMAGVSDRRNLGPVAPLMDLTKQRTPWCNSTATGYISTRGCPARSPRPLRQQGPEDGAQCSGIIVPGRYGSSEQTDLVQSTLVGNTWSTCKSEY